jgi:hypothetical protein
LRPKRDGAKENCEEDQRLESSSPAFWHDGGQSGTKYVIQVNEAFENERGPIRPLVRRENMNPMRTNNYSGPIKMGFIDLDFPADSSAEGL